jgi:hypothetical protein
MKKFKYVVGGIGVNSKNTDTNEQQKILNKMGKDGFELVSVVVISGYIMFYFKKEISQKIGDTCPK